MAAPSGIVWGSTVGSYGRIGIYRSVSSTNDKTTVNVEVWFWSKYSVSDTGNTLYYDNRSSSGSASTSQGSVSISTTNDSGSGWSESNQKKLKSYSYTYSRGTTAVTRYLYAKLANIDRVGGTMYASTTFTIPKLSSYVVTYNANGGSGAPSSQTKWYGKSLTLSSTKPTRTGYSFLGWATSASATSANGSYDPGDSYTSNAKLTLYAVWKANTYTVKFNANGGTGAPANQTKTYGVALTLSSTKPTRANYTFLGWSTSATATSATYSAGGKYTANSGVTLYAIWKLAYTPPKIADLKVSRCSYDAESDKYNASDEGTYAHVYFRATAFQTVTGLSDNIVIRCVDSTGNQIDEAKYSSTVNTTGIILSKYVGDGKLDIDTTYTIIVEVSDGTGVTTARKTLSAAKYIFDLRKGGTGVAFNKAAELDGYLDNNFKTRLRDTIHIDNNRAIFGIDPTDGTDIEALNPQNANGNTVVGWGNYSRGKGSTNIYGHDINLGVSNIPTGKMYYQPYLRAGDSVRLIIRTAGYVTNSGKDVTFHVPFGAPVIGNPTITIASADGIVLRQNGNYTHGSGASTFIFPDIYTQGSIGYTAVDKRYCGVYITARFTAEQSAIHVTNNSAIGVYWSGTITFT